MIGTAKNKSFFPPALSALWTILFLVVALFLPETRVWGFTATPQPTSGVYASVTPTSIGENYDGCPYDASDSLLAAEGPLTLPAPRPTFGSSLSDVSKSVFKNGSLPDNFITKAEAKALGWNQKAGNLDAVAPGKSIGGDVFGNKEGLLPSAPGRTWFEADLNYSGGYRGGERLLYSNDGKLFYSGDHYKTFQQIGN